MIPIDYHLTLVFLSIIFFVITLMLLFINPDFNKTIAAMLLSFINIAVSFIAGIGFFSVDFYGYDTTGTIVSNYNYEMSSIGILFIGITYICVLFLLYSLYLLYEKPWDAVRKIEGNPYVNDSKTW